MRTLWITEWTCCLWMRREKSDSSVFSFAYDKFMQLLLHTRHFWLLRGAFFYLSCHWESDLDKVIMPQLCHWCGEPSDHSTSLYPVRSVLIAVTSKIYQSISVSNLRFYLWSLLKHNKISAADHGFSNQGSLWKINGEKVWFCINPSHSNIHIALFSQQFLWYWQGEFLWWSGAS